MNFRHFSLKEFDSPDIPGSGSLMNLSFVRLLDDIRHSAGIPFLVSSGFRTTVHNQKVGGVTNSAHLRGLAADIVANSMLTRKKIIASALYHNVARIGIAKTFIHLDNDLSLPLGIYVY